MVREIEAYCVQSIETIKRHSPWVWVISVLIAFEGILFYQLMQMTLHVMWITVATVGIWLLLFFGFRWLWGSFAVTAVLSVLMFSDVLFNAYFHGYLSVAMAGSGKYLGDVQNVIGEILQPQYFLLLIDLPIMAFAVYRLGKREKARRWPIKLAAVLLTSILVGGSLTPSPFFRSVGNLEFFAFHTKDIVSNVFGWEKQEPKAKEEDSFTSDQQDPLFGIAKGRNLIVVQLEGFQNFVIQRNYEGQELSPVLNHIIDDPGTLYFDQYYMQIAAGNTSDAEFATNNSLYGTEQSYTYELFKGNQFRGLPVLLKEIGYQTVAMHGYEGSFWSRDAMYPAEGFDRFIDDEGYHPSRVHGWGILDQEFYEQSVDYLKETQQPFYAFVVSLSNHTPFQMEEDLCRITLDKEHQGTRFGNYLNSVAYSDQAILHLISALKQAGLYENSVIVFYGDHFGLAQNDEDNAKWLTDFLGRPYRFDQMANIPLIVHIPGTNIRQTVHTAGGQMDFLPTIAYLLGFESLDTVYLGQNLLMAEEGFVIQSRYAPAGSFFTDDLCYFMSMDGVFENGKAWSTKTGEELPLEGLRPLSDKAAGLVRLSETYLEDDIIRQRYGDLNE